MRVATLTIAAALASSLAAGAAAQPAPRVARPVPPLALGQAVGGELTPLDPQRRSGKYEDAFTFTGRAGQRIDLRLSSDDFDPYLLVTGPGGFQMSNDDEGGSDTLNSRLILALPADGSYRVSATSFAPGGMGAYRLEAHAAAADAQVDTALAAAPVAFGTTVSGRLDASDGQIGRHYGDRYRFTARRGQRVALSLTSTEFDTVLSLQGPDGTTLTNDDLRATAARRATTDSRIETVVAEDGEYLLTVSSYGEGERGKYQLSVRESAGNPRHAGVRGGARVLAVAVGVSDYDRMSDLPNTDDDATELLASLRAAGLLHPASVALTNNEATTARVGAALRRAAEAAGPDDVVMFFFSGHGDQVDVRRSAAELDGRSETIELYDAAMTDAQLQPLIDRLNGRMVMIAIDSCFSGGFRNLVNRPNVMGLFSSEEDLTSLVASRHEAGGYLSYHLRQGLTGEADNDGDRVVTAGELTTYLRRRFRLEGDIQAQTREDEYDYQYLMVERGGVHIEDGVVRLGAPAQAAVAATTLAEAGEVKRR